MYVTIKSRIKCLLITMYLLSAFKLLNSSWSGRQASSICLIGIELELELTFTHP